MRSGKRARMCMAPAPHVDGDPSWGLARSRRPGASAGRPRKVLSEVSGHLTAGLRRPPSAATGASWPQEDEMPARKTKRPAEADTETEVRAEELAAAESAAAATMVEAAVGAADVTRGEDETAAAATYSAFSEAAAQRGSRDAAQGAVTLSMADEVAAGGAVAAVLSTDEFRRGMELAGIAGQVQVAAELLGGVRQPTLAAFLASTSEQLRVLAVDAISRATEGAVVAHGAEHLAGQLAALGLTEVGDGRDEYATSAALGAADVAYSSRPSPTSVSPRAAS